MAKEHSGSPKQHQLDPKRKRLTLIFAVSGLCFLFYTLGAWQTTSTTTATQSDIYSRAACKNQQPQKSISQSSSSSSQPLDFQSHHSIEINESVSIQKIPPCDFSYSEYTPCQDPVRSKKFERSMLKYRERHCPKKEEELVCLIPAPPKYKAPFKWPQSRDYAWYDNIPHKELSIEKAVQNWIQVEGDRFRFPGGGTMFPRGADAYIDDIGELIPITSGSIRTVEEGHYCNVICTERYPRSTSSVRSRAWGTCDDRNYGF